MSGSSIKSAPIWHRKGKSINEVHGFAIKRGVGARAIFSLDDGVTPHEKTVLSQPWFGGWTPVARQESTRRAVSAVDLGLNVIFARIPSTTFERGILSIHGQRDLQHKAQGKTVGSYFRTIWFIHSSTRFFRVFLCLNTTNLDQRSRYWRREFVFTEGSKPTPKWNKSQSAT